MPFRYVETRRRITMSDRIERQWKRKIKSKETLQRMAGVSEEAELHGLDIERRFLQPTPYPPPLSNSSAEHMKTEKKPKPTLYRHLVSGFGDKRQTKVYGISPTGLRSEPLTPKPQRSGSRTPLDWLHTISSIFYTRIPTFHLIKFTSGTNIKEECEFPRIASYSEFSTLL